MKKYNLVTAGDIQLFSAIVGGLLSNAEQPVNSRLFAEGAFSVFDAIKDENESREPKLKRPSGAPSR